MPRYESFALKAGRYFWGFKLTPVGRFLVFAICGTAIGLLTVEVPIYQIFLGLVGFVGASETVGLLFRPNLKIDGQFPSTALAGQPVTGNLLLTNLSWRPAFDLMFTVLSLPRGITQVDAHRCLLKLSPGEQAALPITLLPARRGLFRIPPIRGHSTFPFNVMRFGAAATPPQNLVVLPSWHPLERLEIPHSVRFQAGGLAHAAGVGHSPEYLGNREYIPGEPARRLDFRAWARLGRPVVREFHEEYNCRIALILDTHIPGRRRPRVTGYPNLEAAISLMASVTEFLNLGEYTIDLFASGPELYVFRTSTGRTCFDNVLEILAGVEPCRRNPFELVSPVVAQEMESISIAVCILLAWDETRAALIRSLIQEGLAVKVILVAREDAPSPPQDIPYLRFSPDEIMTGKVTIV